MMIGYERITADPAGGLVIIVDSRFKFYLKQYSWLITSSVLSILLLAVFILMQYCAPEVLSLDVKWIAVALVPLIVGFIIAGYIHSIKGFGLELVFKKPVEDIPLLSSNKVIAGGPGMLKKDMEFLQSLGDAKRQSIRRLIFTYGKQEYYGACAIQDYHRFLTELEYFEVQKKNRRLVCLLPVSPFFSDNNQSEERLLRFIEFVEEEDIDGLITMGAVIDSIDIRSNIVDALARLRIIRSEFLPVVSKKVCVGVLTAQLIEEALADSILFLYQSAGIQRKETHTIS